MHEGLWISWISCRIDAHLFNCPTHYMKIILRGFARPQIYLEIFIYFVIMCSNHSITMITIFLWEVSEGQEICIIFYPTYILRVFKLINSFCFLFVVVLWFILLFPMNHGLFTKILWIYFSLENISYSNSFQNKNIPF